MNARKRTHVAEWQRVKIRKDRTTAPALRASLLIEKQSSALVSNKHWFKISTNRGKISSLITSKYLPERRSSSLSRSLGPVILKQSLAVV